MKIKSLVTLSGLLGCLLASGAAHAQALCKPGGYGIGFFNGVWNTHAKAQEGLDALRLLNGDTYNNEPVTYDLYYNETGLDQPDATRFEDLVEVFKQRAQEQDGILADRWETFWELLDGESGPDSVVGRLSGVVGGLDQLTTALRDDLKTKTLAALTGLASHPPTIQAYAEHRTRLDAHMTQREKLLLVAHSQGNLFMNMAYDYGKSVVGTDAIKAVHIAPASPTLRGSYTLADLDLVIQSLAILGTVPQANVAIPAFPPLGSRPAPYDISGHELIATYLDPRLDTYTSVKTQISDALTALVAPSTTAGSTGYFTITLTWDGTGDVDLHTFEPNSGHVYYSAKTGQSGVLDVDNITANGPEHYYASCDPTKLKVGDYSIGINNFARALGRTATVQIASYTDGVLLSKSLDVGPTLGTSGNNSPIHVFTVTVTKNLDGSFLVSAI